jgi:23S rRNA pseudouridine1911/1915/1917 synthase
MAHLHHPVVGDTLYGAAATQTAQHPDPNRKSARETMTLGRNFLHAAELEFTHPRTGALIQLSSPLPAELNDFLARLRS